MDAMVKPWHDDNWRKVADAIRGRMSKTLADRLRALPDGAILKQVFYGLVAISATMIFIDLREQMENESADAYGMPSLSPVLMDRPERDNQIRPYLPLTRPMAPDETSERLHSRPREESEAVPMHFRLGTHGAAFAEGTITPGTAEAFAAFLASERAKHVTEIVLHSPGGSVTDAADMAHQIREDGERRGAGTARRIRRRSAGMDACHGDAEGEALPVHAGRAEEAEAGDEGRGRLVGMRRPLCRHSASD